MILAMKMALCVYISFGWLVLSGAQLSPDDILQPPGHGINQVLQVYRQKVSIALQCTEYAIASSVEGAAS
jgi:hypothetical protein